KIIILFLRVFIDYDGPDRGRFSFNAIISDVDLRLKKCVNNYLMYNLFIIIFRTTYLPVWKKLIDEKAIVGIMSAISAVNSILSAANKYLLTYVLRNEWNFTGYVISKVVVFLMNFIFFSFSQAIVIP